MSKSGSLRVAEVRDAFRLIGDCRDLGNDPDLWHERMFEGLTRLIGCSIATGGEGIWRRPHKLPKPMTSFDIGFDDRARLYFVAFMRDGRLSDDPIFRALQQKPTLLVTRTRRDIVSDREVVWVCRIQ